MIDAQALAWTYNINEKHRTVKMSSKGVNGIRSELCKVFRTFTKYVYFLNTVDTLLWTSTLKYSEMTRRH